MSQLVRWLLFLTCLAAFGFVVGKAVELWSIRSYFDGPAVIEMIPHTEAATAEIERNILCCLFWGQISNLFLMGNLVMAAVKNKGAGRRWIKGMSWLAALAFALQIMFCVEYIDSMRPILAMNDEMYDYNDPHLCGLMAGVQQMAVVVAGMGCISLAVWLAYPSAKKERRWFYPESPEGGPFRSLVEV